MRSRPRAAVPSLDQPNAQAKPTAIPAASGKVVIQAKPILPSIFQRISPCDAPVPTIAAQTHLVIISGLGGEKKYTESFTQLSATLADAASKRFGIPDAGIVWLGEDGVSKRPHYRGQASKVNIERAVTQHWVEDCHLWVTSEGKTCPGGQRNGGGRLVQKTGVN